jgi:hypothetical protein
MDMMRYLTTNLVTGSKALRAKSRVVIVNPLWTESEAGTTARVYCITSVNYGYFHSSSEIAFFMKLLYAL